ncbi:hypothetical protein AALP_AA8G011800 [Arabis alpina]|uniref:Uncharacterized protein n=1 Tax=Arabis alpina TaxID=50452 RepID=A0A087G485_ARAAL|nr:hypothetical protein AALP_AA8G011800 [Arabis alpina]
MMKSSGRKALQPKNIFFTPTIPPSSEFLKPKKLPLLSKENLEIVVGTIDASLAEELGAFKKKLERLREDRERTEKLLKERDGVMDLQMTSLLERGEAQKCLEIQVDRLFRLKELHAYSSKISPIRSLRAKEQQKRDRFSSEPMAEEPEEEEESSVKNNLVESETEIMSPGPL